MFPFPDLEPVGKQPMEDEQRRPKKRRKVVRDEDNVIMSPKDERDFYKDLARNNELVKQARDACQLTVFNIRRGLSSKGKVNRGVLC